MSCRLHETVALKLTRYSLGVQIQNMKMVFKFYCTWRRVTFEKLMMKIYDFFYLAKSLLRHLLIEESLFMSLLLMEICHQGSK